MTEFEKELEKNMKLNKVAYERENIYSDFLISKRDIERVFHDWQPPKPLVVVPQIVARYIKTEEDNDYNRVGTLVYGHYTADDRGEKHSELHEWIAENFDTFLEAIVNGYTVEKEQLYEVEFYVDEEDDRCLLMKTGKTISFEYESQNEGHYQQQFTEAEIKEIYERYWTFAVPVEEV